ncbi:hypothetical protein Ahy_B01g055846 [Arachis hypogaea]|uniref:Protein FAR1-RELATED SEQUENCE n=1 Tax=Arachis hypogaea TaxID=3818 RepID=A0A445AXG1_ARAHY|nr:hypothetical protein Ahy_B01g055846 [Arachis hypogaea]
MKEKNHNFFFEFELEVDQSINIPFWVDIRSRAACEYNLVFGSFVGVNYHNQSTLLGCVLMKNEDTQSLK